MSTFPCPLYGSQVTDKHDFAPPGREPPRGLSSRQHLLILSGDNYSGTGGFCNQEIERSDVDPCCVTVETVDGRWQVWRCHARCFRERVFSRDDGLFDPEHF